MSASTSFEVLEGVWSRHTSKHAEEFVQNLVGWMRKEDFELLDKKNKALLTIPGGGGQIMPSYAAAVYRHEDVIKYLYENCNSCAIMVGLHKIMAGFLTNVSRLICLLMLGDIIVSVETAARQAEERGHTLLDELRILMVHGLLHLLGFDHELSDKAEAEMKTEEECLLESLGWKGKQLIKSALSAEDDESPLPNTPDGRKKAGSLRFYKPKFSYIFCDMEMLKRYLILCLRSCRC